MTITTNVEVDQAQVREALSILEFCGGRSKDAIRVAINKTGPKFKTAASRAIREQIRLKAAYVNKRIDFVRATNKNLSGAIKTPSRGILLSRFSTDTKVANENISWLKPPPIPSRGIAVKVKPKGSAKQLDSSFFYMALPKSRALAIVRRRAPGSFGPQGGKYEVAYGPSISQVLQNDTRERLLPEAGEELTKQMLDAVRFLLQKKYPKE